MKNSHLVSVIIPCFNAEDFLEECIASVLAQTYQNLEIIVVDDGSTDDSLVIAEKLGRKEDRVEVFHHAGGQNKGVGFTRQLGIDRSKGDFIAFLDADDLFEPEKIERQLLIMGKEPNCVLSHTHINAIAKKTSDRNLFEKHFNKLGFSGGRYSLRQQSDYLEHNYICISSVVVRANILKKQKIAHQQLFQYEDWTLWVRLSSFGDFVHIPDRLARYRVHPESATEKVRNSDLQRHYSMIEFLLSLASTEDDPKLLSDVMSKMVSVMSELMAVYSPLDQKDAVALLSELETDKTRLKMLQQKQQYRLMAALMNSVSYRLGRVITWPARYIRDSMN